MFPPIAQTKCARYIFRYRLRSSDTSWVRAWAAAASPSCLLGPLLHPATAAKTASSATEDARLMSLIDLLALPCVRRLSAEFERDGLAGAWSMGRRRHRPGNR